MLNDWEQQQLSEMEADLRSDKALGRVLSAPTRRERLWSSFRLHFYPAGYIGCSLVYIFLAMESSLRALVALALLVAFVVGVVLEVRASGLKEFILHGLEGMGGGRR
jgi:hypothetical protein